MGEEGVGGEGLSFNISPPKMNSFQHKLEGGFHLGVFLFVYR